MKKILAYISGALLLFSTSAVLAADKFEILPDLPESLSYAMPSANASTVTNSAETTGILGANSIGHEPNIASVLISLLFVIILIYITGILYAKLNKFGSNALIKQKESLEKNRASVISTTNLGSSRTLHVIELDGKRFLIGASPNSVQLIKELGATEDLKDLKDTDYSHIEIPNIKIPKIEIPKIEIPSINFLKKCATKVHPENEELGEENNDILEDESINNQEFIEEEAPANPIDSLFNNHHHEEAAVEKKQSEHSVDPDEYALYKKYLG